MVKTKVSSYLSKQEKLENLCLIAVHLRGCKLWLLIRDVKAVVCDQCLFMDFNFVSGNLEKCKE